MSWLCLNCKVVNANLNERCSVCKATLRPAQDERDESQYLLVKTLIFALRKLDKFGGNEFLQAQERKMSASDTMTREEKLFANFFNDEKILVSQMDDFQLRAHIEELQDIAREARARLTCSTGEDRERVAKKKAKKGISETVASDDFTSETINNIQKRTQKMSKTDKEIERLVFMGIDRADAENMYKATTINKVAKIGATAVIEENKRLDISVVVNSVMNPNPGSEPKAFVNPFAPVPQKESKSNPPSEAAIVIPQEPAKSEVEGLTKTLSESEEKPKFINPFAK